MVDPFDVEGAPLLGAAVVETRSMTMTGGGSGARVHAQFWPVSAILVLKRTHC